MTDKFSRALSSRRAASATEDDGVSGDENLPDELKASSEGTAMKTPLAIAASLTISCIGATADTFKPTFVVDYGECGADPIVTNNNVTFGSGANCYAGRVVSTNRYINITKVTATADLSKVQQDYVNAAFYLIENDKSPGTQPKGDPTKGGNYCDAGGNHNDFNCREIDFLETNGNKITQTTLHLGDGGGSAPQRYEYSFAATAATEPACFNYGVMQASPKPPGAPTNGLHSLVDAIDMSKPFVIEATFDDFNLGMKTVFKQGNSIVFNLGKNTVVVYDSSVGDGAEGSAKLNYQDLKRTMGDGTEDGTNPKRENGYWILVSFWQGYSPVGPGSSKWYNDTGGPCGHGNLCGAFDRYWAISDIEVTADKELGPGE
jgi:hypothetical protein